MALRASDFKVGDLVLAYGERGKVVRILKGVRGEVVGIDAEVGGVVERYYIGEVKKSE
jgi:hypothetical protein